MRVKLTPNEDGSIDIERKIVGQASGIELRLLLNLGLTKGDKIKLTQFPDGSGRWEKIKVDRKRRK